MDTSQRKRFWFVVFSVITIGAVIILVGGVSTLDLALEGQPLPRKTAEASPPDTPSPSTRVFTVSVRVLLMVSAALLPFAVVYYLVSPEARRRLLRDLIAVLSVLLPLFLLWQAQPEVLSTASDILSPPATSGDLPRAPEVTFTPNPRQWLIIVATVGLALLLAAIVVALGLAVWRRRQRPSMRLDELARQAQDAIDAIEAGADLRDTVTRCYFEMMLVLREERGLQRQRAMTPREFETALEKAGIPTTQVRRLTRLFEQVRYGDKHLGEQEERQAVISLSSVVRFCRSAS